MRSLNWESVYEKRFGVFLSSLMLLITATLVIPPRFIEEATLFLVLQNILVSLLFLRKKKLRSQYFIYFIFTVLLIGFLWTLFDPHAAINQWVYSINFIYFVFITIHLYTAIYRLPDFDMDAVFGVFAGFILMAFISGFLFLIIESFVPNSFKGIENTNNVSGYVYFSFITLLTIGYGDIVPVSEVARKAVILVALIGHFYTVFVTAIIISKMMNR